MSLIHNERTKLLANNLDRASTACLVAGFIAPVSTIGFLPISSFSTAVWIFAAFVLHIAGRRVLGRLER